MKNLKILCTGCVKNELLKDTTHFCIDNDAHNIYFADAHNMFCLDNLSNQVTLCTELKFDLINHDLQIVAMDFIIETQSVCVSFSSGDIITYTPSRNEIDCVGSVASGLSATGWSPDQELLVVLTGENTLILMTKDFDPLVEKDLHPSEFGTSKPITVGWGSKETQFHGSEGKGAATIKKIVPKPAVPWDDQRHRISWRGDGELFVTSVIDLDQGYRKLRIWSREAVLQCTNEIKDGLEHPLCWRPLGNLITCTQQNPNKHEVIFFEKNGLHHGEFTLPFQPNTFAVNEVSWNLDSSVLAIWGHEMTDSTSGKFCVMLWTVNNYHWYMKQRLDFNKEKYAGIKLVTWDQYYPYKLHILCCDGEYLQYTWGWTTFCSPSSNQIDAFAAVIDNDNALVTPFNKMIVPPPMCAFSFKLSCSINHICFAPDQSNGRILLVLADGRVALLSQCTEDANLNLPDECKLNFVAAGGNGFKTVVKPHSFCGIYRINWENDVSMMQYPLSICHWTWMKEREILCIGVDDKTHANVLLAVALPNEQNLETMCLNGRFCKKVNGIVIGMCSDGDVAALQLSDGKVLKYEHGQLSPWLCSDNRELAFPQPCSVMSLCTSNRKKVLLGLTDRFRLFCNDSVLVSNCTSFMCHDDFLLVTTCDHKLKCFLKDSVIAEIQNLSSAEISSQRIECGAKIVVTIPGDTKVILQMPRGNLEVIHPRPLVLSSICNFLDNFQFGKAFEIAKKHRINMNLLYDHNPKLFLDSIGMFVKQISSPTELNLFLTNLQLEDVCSTIYSFAYKAKCRPANNPVTGNKINVICDAFRIILENNNDERYFQTLLATYAKKCPPELDKALMKIKELKVSMKKGKEDPQTVAEEGLKFLLYLVDISELYNVALGTYDFEIAIMVAEKSQKDPKEYLPFLNDLQKLEENYRKYKIDMHLQRYKKALQHVCKCGEYFEECLTLIKTQRLYTSALYLFPPSSDCFKIIWQEYGDYLMQKMYYEEAGLVYTKSENYEKALTAYQESANWQLALNSARKLHYSTERLALLSRDISQKLIECHRYLEASLLLEQYVQDIEESIVTLIKGQEWDSSLHMMTRYNRLDIALTHLKPALIDQYQYLCTFLDQTQTDFCSHTERLKAVRIGKEQASFESSDLTKCLDDDLFSETSSVTGSLASSTASKELSGSLITKKSSRSRRKHELKKYRLKEGSANEDLALMTVLSEAVTKVDKLKDNFHSFLRTLVQFDYEFEAKNIQQKLNNICKIIEAEMSNIWSPMKNVDFSSDMNFGPNSTANSIATAIQMQKSLSMRLTDCKLTPPAWRTNMEFSLHIFE